MTDREATLPAFQQAVLGEFAFLAKEFGVGHPETEKPDPYTIQVTYRNRTTAVQLAFEQRENQVFAYLVRLREGRLPPYFRNGKDWAYLDTLLRQHSIDIPRKQYGDWLSDVDLKRVLNRYASGLRKHGRAIMQGDFEEFPAISVASLLDQGERAPQAGRDESG